MGEIAEDTANGLTCEICGCWMPDVEKWIEAQDKGKISANNLFEDPPGYPRTCEDCEDNE